MRRNGGGVGAPAKNKMAKSKMATEGGLLSTSVRKAIGHVREEVLSSLSECSYVESQNVCV